MFKKIGILCDQRAHTSTAEITARLRQDFPDAPLLRLKAEDFFSFLLFGGQHDLAILPGITTEDCLYDELLEGETGKKALYDFVADKGGTMMTICAGSYYISEHTFYETPWGIHKQRGNTTPLFQAAAYGPVPQCAVPPGRNGQSEACTMTRIDYIDATGHEATAKVAYGNGPFMHLPLRLITKAQTEVLARYADIPGHPVAAALRHLGKGRVLWLGILPHIGAIDLPVQGRSGLQADFINALKQHEPQRAAFWAHLLQRLTAPATDEAARAHPAKGREAPLPKLPATKTATGLPSDPAPPKP